ncbi:DNA-binding response regulator [Streptomyces sp. WG7]|uniref:DNA-binding response regulator n=1 Tax=Streptomyces sp. WG7 TaxID=3417650 RepID=UPI003CEBE5E1
MSEPVIEQGFAAGAVRPEPADHAAHVERVLLEASALIENTVSLHRQRAELPTPVARTGGVQITEVLESLIGPARHTVCAMLDDVGEFTDTTVRLLTKVPEEVTVRVLCSAEVADSSLAPLTGLTDKRVAVRVSRSELRAILVVDGSASLVQSAESSPAPAAVVYDAATVRALELFFASAWSRGRSLAGHLQLSPRVRTELARYILERLRAGHTDETAARELNVSLRTYRRYVAEIMRALDANSRFQAGVRAVEFGLLSE